MADRKGRARDPEEEISLSLSMFVSPPAGWTLVLHPIHSTWTKDVDALTTILHITIFIAHICMLVYIVKGAIYSFQEDILSLNPIKV